LQDYQEVKLNKAYIGKRKMYEWDEEKFSCARKRQILFQNLFRLLRQLSSELHQLGIQAQGNSGLRNPTRDIKARTDFGIVAGAEAEVGRGFVVGAEVEIGTGNKVEIVTGTEIGVEIEAEVWALKIDREKSMSGMLFLQCSCFLIE